RFPAVVLALSVLAVGLGVILYLGIPHPWADAEEGKPTPMLVPRLETGLMPAMDEGAFVLDYWAPAGTPLQDTEKMAKDLEHILSENPDVAAYVRRTGAELGLFATQSNRGDIQVVLRPAEDDPYSLIFKPVRPKFSEIEDDLKAMGKERAEKKYGPKPTRGQIGGEGKAAIREQYRRRPVKDVKDEIKEEVEERFSEHQLKIETVQIMEDELNDMSGASKPIEIKI